MKKLSLLSITTSSYLLQKYYSLNLKILHISVSSIMTGALLLTSGCLAEDTSEELANAAIKKAAIELQRQQEIADIEDNISNSYARLAAKRADLCPKMLQKENDNPIMERVNEVMVDDHCDYYLYPEVSQRLKVTLNTDQIEALLIVPLLYNFANGDYIVDSYDKHIIRLTYTGPTYKPERLKYNVAIEVMEE